jgi:hypothetical protein
MIPSRKSENPGVVTGVHLAASALPPRATSLRGQAFSIPLTPRPFRSILFLETPGTPLPNALGNVRKNRQLFPRRISK